MPLDVSTSVLATYDGHLGIWLVYKIGSFDPRTPLNKVSRDRHVSSRVVKCAGNHKLDI